MNGESMKKTLCSESSDESSLAPSSPNSPKQPVYYVQSPSRDSHDGDKSSTNQATTPSYNSPMESPTHPSQSRASSASRISGNLRYNLGRKRNRKRNNKGWPDFNVIEEEGEYEDINGEVTRTCQFLIVLTGLLMVFSFICLIVWGASRPYRVRVDVKGLTVYNVYAGVGSDYSGVPTKLLTINCSVEMNIFNPATFFGIHVSSSSVNLLYSQITVGRGEMMKYYQPKKSRKTVLVNIEGSKVPLYGAGASLEMSSNGGGRVPLKLEFDIKSRGNLVGKLVKTEHRRRISCFVVIDSKNTKPTMLKKDSCRYD